MQRTLKVLAYAPGFTPDRWCRVGMVAIWATMAGGCGSDDDLKCGPGTEKHAGVCVAVVDPSVTCGEGTQRDEETGECVPLVTCDEDTVFNPDTGTCESRTECGQGTVLNLSTGECEPEISCGSGTVLVDGECVPEISCGPGTVHNPTNNACDPVEPCVEGTEYNPATGLCESDTVCEGDHVLVGNLCLPADRGLAADADAEEIVPDFNDPEYGGTAMPLTLESIGEETIFLGNIGRPADLDGNGLPDQDRDVWYFEGVAGQFLHIQVLSAGLPQPAFILTGPKNYERQSRMGNVIEADRYVYLPRSGRYELIVAPAVNLLANMNVGGPLAGYIGVIEQVALPAATPLAPGADFDTPTQVMGTFIDLQDNFIQLQAGAGTGVEIDFTDFDEAVVPAVIAVDGSGKLVSELVIDPEEGTWVGTYVGEPNGTTVILDWVSSTTSFNDFTVELITVPVMERSALSSNITTSTPRLDIKGYETGAFLFPVEVPQVIEFKEIAETSMTMPDIQVLSPRGTGPVIWDDDEGFFYGEPGDYVVFVKNDYSYDESNVYLLLEAVEPLNLGDVDLTGNPEAGIVGTSLTYWLGDEENFWGLVGAEPDVMMEFVVEAEAGEPDLFIRNLDGEVIHDVRRASCDRKMHVLNDDGETMLVQITPHNSTPAVVNWSLLVSALPMPTKMDVEPNDIPLQANELDGVPFSIQGTLMDLGGSSLDDRDKDIYRLTLDHELGPEQSLAIWFDNVDANEGSLSWHQVSMRIYDENFSPLAAIPGQSADDYSDYGTLLSSGVVLIPSYAGVGPFYVIVTEFSVEDTQRYVLRGEVLDIPVELEDNDTTATADQLGPLPAEYYGYWDSENDTADIYRLDLNNATPANNSVIVELFNLETFNDFTLTLEDDQGAVIATHTESLTSIQVPSLAPGTYFIHIESTASTSPHYRLQVRLGPPMETEPNNIAAEATGIGELSVGTPLVVDGYNNDGTRDILTFTLAAPLTVEQSVLVYGFNLSDTSDLAVGMYAGADPDGAGVSLVSRDESEYPMLIQAFTGTGPFSLLVEDSTDGGPDRYRFQLEVGPPAESEPNDDQVTAQLLGPMPIFLYGTLGTGDTDVFKVVLDNDLPVNQALYFLAHNVEEDRNIEIKLLGSDFSTEIRSISGYVAPIVSPGGMLADTYYVTLSEPFPSSSETDFYELYGAVVDAI